MKSDRKEYFREYRKKFKPVKADITVEERTRLDEILKSKNLSIVSWIRQKIDEDYKKLYK